MALRASIASVGQEVFFPLQSIRFLSSTALTIVLFELRGRVIVSIAEAMRVVLRQHALPMQEISLLVS